MMSERTKQSRPSSMLRALMALLAVLGLSMAALAFEHSTSNEGAIHAPVSTSTASEHAASAALADEAAGAAFFPLSAGEAGELAGICLVAMLCGTVLLLAIRRLLAPRALLSPRTPRGGAPAIDLPRAPRPRPVRLVELSISRT